MISDTLRIVGWPGGSPVEQASLPAVLFQSVINQGAWLPGLSWPSGKTG